MRDPPREQRDVALLERGPALCRNVESAIPGGHEVKPGGLLRRKVDPPGASQLAAPVVDLDDAERDTSEREAASSAATGQTWTTCPGWINATSKSVSRRSWP